MADVAVAAINLLELEPEKVRGFCLAAACRSPPSSCLHTLAGVSSLRPRKRRAQTPQGGCLKLDYPKKRFLAVTRVQAAGPGPGEPRTPLH